MSVGRTILAHDVFTAAYDRVRRLYDRGDRVVVSCSGGKDSTVCVELAIMAARDAGRLPVEVVMRDEEIMFPGTFEYCERLANRVDEVDFHWVIAGQPIVNVFNRFNPYFWVFDDRVDPDRWVRKPPGFDRGAGPETPPLHGRQPYWIDSKNIWGIIQPDRFTPDWPADVLASITDEDGRMRITGRRSFVSITDTREDLPRLVTLVGLRTSESPRRAWGVYSKRGYVRRTPNAYGAWEATPIYDWVDGDVWRFLKETGADYNRAYDVMLRMGVPAKRLRIAPPTLTTAGVHTMNMASRAWPKWFDRVTDRLEGVRTAAQFGLRSVQPYRRLGETWEQCFYREIIDPPKVPDWIKERALFVRDHVLTIHRGHAGSMPFPDVSPCEGCRPIQTWHQLASYMYNGDPFSMKVGKPLQPIEPEFFREGAGRWEGSVAFA